MIYIFAIFSSMAMIVLIFGLIFLKSEWHKLGFVRKIVGMYLFGTTWFIPLFYGSMGSLFGWHYAAPIYSYSWLAIILGPFLLGPFILIVNHLFEKE